MIDFLSENRTNFLALIDETEDLDYVNLQLQHFLNRCDDIDISSDSDLVSAYNTIKTELGTRGITHTPIETPTPAATL
jgi:hypothetical protein